MKYTISTISQLSKALKSIRKNITLSQQKIAATTGMLPKTISLLENHPEKSTLESLFKLVNALNYKIQIIPKETPDKEW